MNKILTFLPKDLITALLINLQVSFKKALILLKLKIMASQQAHSWMQARIQTQTPAWKVQAPQGCKLIDRISDLVLGRRMAS